MKTIISQAKHKNNEEPILEVLDVSRDTIIIWKIHEMYISTTNGKSWERNHLRDFANKVTIDDHNVLWALYSGGGIHEQKTAMLYKSVDMGNTWDEIPINVSIFSPYRIISHPHKRLRILCWDHKIYSFNNEHKPLKWVVVDSLKEFENQTNDAYCPPYKIEDVGDMNKKIVTKITNGRKDTIGELENVSEIESLNIVKDTLFIAGSNIKRNGLAYAYFAAIINDKWIKIYTVPGSAVDVIKGTNNRIWVFNYSNLYRKVKDSLIRVY